jgi:S-phase kinase-associated protein 1
MAQTIVDEDVNMLVGLDDEKSPVDDIILVSSENNEFKVSKAYASQSKYLQAILEDPEATNIRIPVQATDDIVKIIVSYLGHHHENKAEDIPRPVPSGNLRDFVSIWDADLIDNLENDVIFKLIDCVNKLDIERLLELAVAKLATLIRGQSTESLRKMFNIVNDFTPEEEAKVIEDNKWAMADP